MKMRKALSFVLVLALVLGSFSMAFAADPIKQGSDLSDIADSANYDAIVANSDLGIITGYEDGSFKPENNVNRAEFAAMITRMLGVPESALVGYANTGFTDMSGYGWANSYVGFCAAKGIVNGYGDGTFGPGNTITVNEAVTMVLRAVGYVSNSDELVGNWPSNYVTLGKKLNIYDDVASTTTIDRASAAQVIYNALTTEVVTVNADGDTNFAYTEKTYEEVTIGSTTSIIQVDRAKTVLEVYLDCKLRNAAVYTDTDAADSVVNTREYVGAYVKAIENSDEEVIAIADVKSTFITGEFDTSGAVVAGDTFEATDKDYTLDTVTFTTPASFKNGVKDASYVAPVGGTEYTMAVKISGNKIKEIYSVAVWAQDADFLYEDDMLEDDNIDGIKFTLDDDDEINLASFELVGVNKLAEINEDNVVYVYHDAASSPKVTKIEVGTEIVEGEVTKISSDDEEITVNGKVYVYAADKFTTLTNAVANGGVDINDEVVLYLDVNGYIFDMDVNAKDGGNYAIILETDDEIDGLSGNNAKVKLFLADGTDKVFDVDGDVVVATLIDAGGDWTTAAKAGGMLVEYGLDKNGVIDYLKDMEAEAGYVSTISGDKELTSKLTYNGVPVAGDAILFTVDSAAAGFDPQDEEFYGVTTVEKAKGSEFEAAYYAKNNKISLMVIDGTGTDTNLVYGVAKSWAKSSASSTDYVVTLLVDGVSTEYDVKTSVYNQLNGDANAKKKIYEITVNTAGEITALTDVSAGVPTEIDILTAVSPLTYVNSAFGGVTIDSDATAYMMETGETSFVKVSVNKSNLEGMTSVVLYDVDEDLVADILLIIE